MTLIILALTSIVAAHAADSFTYAVYCKKLLRDQRGTLQIAASGISYKSDDGQTAIRLAFEDVYKADVSDPTVIRIETYDILKRKLTGRRTFTFRLRDGEHDPTLAQFLAQNLKRPVVAAYSVSAAPAFQVPAYHRHRVGGCHGKLEIGADGIRFVSAKTADSRTWLYRDIETVGSMNPFHFRVTTPAETYNFDLKERLAEDAYRLARHRLYDAPPRRSPGL